MKSKRLFQVFVLLTLLFSPFGANQLVQARTGSVDGLDVQIIDRDSFGSRGNLQLQSAISMIVSPSSANIGETTTVTVNLNSVPIEGYTSAEFTCTYDPNLVDASNIVLADLFGTDPVVAIHGPQDGEFIVAIAGSQGNKATSSGKVMAFNLRGLQASQFTVACQARVSTGSNTLTWIGSTSASLTVVGNTPTPTIEPAICDQAQLIADINIPDGTPFEPGKSFVKTWRLKNVGSCVWTTSYHIIFFSGEQMHAPVAIPLAENVMPGQMVDISVPMTAPSSAGTYRGYRMFQNANGALFGTGAQAANPWWLEIRVIDLTVTPGGPTLTPSPTATPTMKPSACDKAEFIADVTVPPGTVMSLGAQFTKTWRLKNVGSCTWTPSYRLAFLSGEQMGTDSSAQFPRDVAPGMTVDLSLNMTAPSTPGVYRGYWIFQNATGGLFGIGPLGNEPWFVDIVVSNATVTLPPTLTVSPSPTGTQPSGTPADTPTPSLTPNGPTVTPIPGTAYDFAARACEAVWFSGAGQLPCPGIDGNPNGFVFAVNNPKLENGTVDSRSGLLTFPQNVQNGYIQGFYPPFHVQSGDHFRSSLTCEFGATNCYVAFRLDYQVGFDPIRTLWGPFLERYEGIYYTADIDLSSLAGKDVKFILTVLSAGVATGDRALWVGPIIYRTNAIPTPSLTPVGSPTPHVSATSMESSTATPVPDLGMLIGQVHAGKPVILSLYRDNAILVTSTTVNTDGIFSLTIPVGTYLVFARADGFLGAEGFVTSIAGNTITMPVISLPAGDIDGNNRIDQFDVLTIGMNYNHPLPSIADLNNDGIINVLDLELLAKYYRKAGFLPWNDYD